MKTTKAAAKVSIRLLLRDSLGNLRTLDATSDDFGVLGYNLYGTLSRVPFSICNMQINRPLPSTIDGYENPEALAAEIALVVGTGVEQVDRVEFAKAIAAGPAPAARRR